MTQSGRSDMAERPHTYTRIELPEHRPVIDVIACCGPDGEHVWLNLYNERGAFLTLAQVHELVVALEEQAAVTTRWLADLDKGNSADG